MPGESPDEHLQLLQQTVTFENLGPSWKKARLLKSPELSWTQMLCNQLVPRGQVLLRLPQSPPLLPKQPLTGLFTSQALFSIAGREDTPLF